MNKTQKIINQIREMQKAGEVQQELMDGACEHLAYLGNRLNNLNK